MFWRYNKFSIAWAVFILLLCGLPGGEFSETQGFIGFDKWLHALLFGILVVSTSVGFLKQNRYPRLHLFAVRTAFLFTLGYGIIIEVLQGTVFVDRSIEADDLLANLAGTCLGTIAFYVIYGRPFPILRSKRFRSLKIRRSTNNPG